MQDSRYPIGPFQRHPVTDPQERARLIESIRLLPKNLRDQISGLSDIQLDTPYREGGWKIRQLVHHIADSHLNCYIRFKWTLTEEQPEIKAYIQDAWAETSENFNAPVMVSVNLLESLHERWAALLSGLAVSDFERKFIHPETGVWTLHETLALYEWHGRHHLAHIQTARNRYGW